MSENGFKEWAIVELLGHRRIAGRVTETTVAGAPMLRVDVPDGFTQFYSVAAVYSITPATEADVRVVASLVNVEPVHVWELPTQTLDADSDRDGPF